MHPYVLPEDLSCLAYTKGPGMGGPLQTVAIAVRTLTQLWNKPIAGVNHCIGHNDMGPAFINVNDPIVFYISHGTGTTHALAYFLKSCRICGATSDIAVGNNLNRIARLRGLSSDRFLSRLKHRAARKGRQQVRRAAVHTQSRVWTCSSAA